MVGVRSKRDFAGNSIRRKRHANYTSSESNYVETESERIGAIKGEVIYQINKELTDCEHQLEKLKNSSKKRTGSIKKIQAYENRLNQLKEGVKVEGGVPVLRRQYYHPPSNESFIEQRKDSYPLLYKALSRNYMLFASYMGDVKDPHQNRRFIKARELAGKNLESTLAIVSLAGSIFFLSNNVTGNAIGSLSNQTSSYIGVGLVIVGLIAGYFWLKNKKVKNKSKK